MITGEAKANIVSKVRLNENETKKCTLFRPITLLFCTYIVF